MSALEFTGERFVPGVRGEIWIEHWHRYHFASRWTRGQRVLDVACGEGYGAALIGREAAHVTGVDISAEAIAHARAHYGNDRVQFVEGSCTRLPLEAASMDVAVSFETLEHIAEHDAFLDELARVLRPEGVLILSCPNKREYSERREFANEFHVKELHREELAALVGKRFPEVAWYGQRPSFFSLIAPDSAADAAAQLVEVSESNPDRARDHLESPLYFVVVASRSRAALERLPAALSVLADRDDWVHRDYENVMKDVQAHQEKKVVLEALVAERDQSIAAILAAKANEKRLYEAALAERDTAIVARDAIITVRQADLAARDATIAAREAEIVRRQGWRWWLKLPYLRLRRRL